MSTEERRISYVEMLSRIEQLDKDIRYLRIEFDNFKQEKSLSDSSLHIAIEKLDAKVDNHVLIEEQYQKKLLQDREEDKKAHEVLTEKLHEVKTLSERTLKYVERVDLAQQPLVEAWENLTGWAKINKAIVGINQWLIPLVVIVGGIYTFFKA